MKTMCRSLVLVLALSGSLAALGCVAAPLAWSPDGSWLAWVEVVDEPRPLLPPDWLAGAAYRRPPVEVPQTEAHHQRLWIARSDGSRPLCLADVRGILSSPAWRSDGRALAYVRLGFTEDDEVTYEIVIQQGVDRRRVIHRETLAVPLTAIGALPLHAATWSPDGGFLTAPCIKPPGLNVFQAETGRLVARYKDAYLPAWAPDSQHLAFFRTGGPEGLYQVDLQFGQPEFLTEAPRPLQPVIWSRDSRSVYLMLRGALRHPGADAIVLAQLTPGDRRPRVVYDHGLAPPLPAEQQLTGIYYTLTPDARTLYMVVVADDQAVQISQVNLARGEVRQRWHPLDPSIPLGQLAVTPDGRKLALRYGAANLGATPAIDDLESRWLISLTPDEPSRIRALATLADAAGRLLDAAPPAGHGGDPAVRVTRLPPAAELEGSRLRRRIRPLAEQARQILDARPPAAPPSRQVDEVRLFFAYLSGHYAEALECLDTLDRFPAGPRPRVLWQVLRAQSLLGLGKVAAARACLEDLVRSRPPRQRVEPQPDGRWSLTPVPDPIARWAEQLLGRPPHPTPPPDPDRHPEAALPELPGFPPGEAIGDP